MSENTGNSINKSPVFGNSLEQLVLKGANCLHTAVVPKFSALEAKKKTFLCPTPQDSRMSV